MYFKQGFESGSAFKMRTRIQVYKLHLNVPICPLPPPHLYPQGTYRNQDFQQSLLQMRRLQGVYCTGVHNQHLLTYVRANIVSVSSQALRKRKVTEVGTEANMVCPHMTQTALISQFSYVPCPYTTSVPSGRALGTNFLVATGPSKQAPPFLTLKADNVFLQFWICFDQALQILRTHRILSLHRLRKKRLTDYANPIVLVKLIEGYLGLKLLLFISTIYMYTVPEFLYNLWGLGTARLHRPAELIPWHRFLGSFRARIFKRLWSSGIDSKEWIPPSYVVWRAGTIILFLLVSFLAPIDSSKILAQA